MSRELHQRCGRASPGRCPATDCAQGGSLCSPTRGLAVWRARPRRACCWQLAAVAEAVELLPPWDLPPHLIFLPPWSVFPREPFHPDSCLPVSIPAPSSKSWTIPAVPLLPMLRYPSTERLSLTALRIRTMKETWLLPL